MRRGQLFYPSQSYPDGAGHTCSAGGQPLPCEWGCVALDQASPPFPATSSPHIFIFDRVPTGAQLPRMPPVLADAWRPASPGHRMRRHSEGAAGAALARECAAFVGVTARFRSVTVKFSDACELAVPRQGVEMQISEKRNQEHHVQRRTVIASPSASMCKRRIARSRPAPWRSLS